MRRRPLSRNWKCGGPTAAPEGSASGISGGASQNLRLHFSFPHGFPECGPPAAAGSSPAHRISRSSPPWRGPGLTIFHFTAITKDGPANNGTGAGPPAEAPPRAGNPLARRDHPLRVPPERRRRTTGQPMCPPDGGPARLEPGAGARAEQDGTPTAGPPSALWRRDTRSPRFLSGAGGA